MLKIKEEISVSDILNTAKYKMMLAKEKEKADPEYAANLEYQAEEYHKLAHEITRTAARNSLNIDISKMIGNTGNYLSLTYDILKKDAKQLRLNLTDPTDINNDKDIKKLAQNTPDNKKEKEKLSKDISHENLKEKAEQTGRDIRDVQMQLLNKNKKDKEEEPAFISALRTTLCQLIVNGKREDAVKMTQKLVLSPFVTKYTSQVRDKKESKIQGKPVFKTITKEAPGNCRELAHRFVTSLKEVFELNEPYKNPRKDNSIPKNKWVYAEYEIRGKDGTNKRVKGFLKRKNHLDMYDTIGNLVCHTVNVYKIRLATKEEIDKIERELPKY